MARPVTACVAIVAIALAAGCFEGEADITLNPDGTGKIVGQITFQSTGRWTGRRSSASGPEADDPEARMKEVAREILKSSRGIEAWEDVSFKRLPDDRIRFMGGVAFDKASARCAALLQAVREVGAAGLPVAIHEARRAVRSRTKRQALQALRRCVVKRAEMRDYPAFRAPGFDIGTGPTEAFCKTLTSRLKGSGMRWDKPNAEAIMTPAALEHSHLWPTCRTHQRKAAA